MTESVERLLAAAPPRPRRIVCLTEETTETLHLLGALDLVVGVSGYTVRPPEARAKPKVSAFLTARFDEILAEDFLCSNPDGSLVDRAAFLAQTARPVTISNLTAHDVRIRILGHVAIIHARTSYTLPDGRTASGRYTDVWARRDGRWLAVSAHVTRG